MKKLCVLFCLLLTVVTLVSCGNKDKDKDKDKNPSDSTSDSTTQEEGLVLSVSGDITIGVGDTKQITAINAKTGMQTSNIFWVSDNTDVADVDFEGKITGKADGTAVITATSMDGESASCTVKVTSVLAGITLDPSELTMNIGDTKELTVGYIPESFSGAELTWVSSDPSVAKVEDGVVEALANGNTTIAVSSGEFTAVCSVTVANPVTSVVLSEHSLSLDKGAKAQLNATILPANATDKLLTWTSSNPTVVSVTDDGSITALQGGTAKITVKSSNGMYDTCEVEVSVPVTGISLPFETLTIDPNETNKLVASIAPVDANVQDVIWTSSDPAIVSVDAVGMIKGLKAGTATITVTTVQGYFKDTCAVTVSNSITSLTFEQTEGNLLVGQTIALVPIKAPETADDAPYTWTSSDPAVADVDETGLVTALKEGKITITVATDKGVSATYTLNVIDPSLINVPLESIKANNMVVEEGETFTLNITVTPSNATEKYVISSGSTSLVTVNGDGTLTALRKGTLYITITGVNGTVSTRCRVTVNEMPADKKAQKQKEYDDALAALNQAHGEALVDINDEYDSDIAVAQASVDNAVIKDVNEYNRQKSAIEKAIAAETDAGNKAILQNELSALVGEWEAYQDALSELDTLTQAKANKVAAENSLYQSNLADLKAQYPYLF